MRYNSMPMGYFSRAFTKQRALSGFKTPYSFYHVNGGRRFFPFTYAYYLKVERGLSLPQPQALARLMQALRNRPTDAERRALVRGYLRDLCRDDAAYEYLFATGEPAAPPDFARAQALRGLFGRSCHHLTPAQLQVVASSPEATGAFMLLANVSDALDTERIAALLDVPRGRCEAALGALKRLRLVRACGGGRWASQVSGRSYNLPPVAPETAGQHARMRENLRGLAARCGEPLWAAGGTFRLERSAVEVTIDELNSVIKTLSGRSQSLVESGAGMPIYLVEMSVRRMIDL